MPQIRAAILSHPGMQRSVNEDSALARFPLFLVADGMGGYEAGDQASRAALHEFDEMVAPDVLSNVQVVSNALQKAREAVDVVSRSTERGAGCTLTGAVLVDYEGQPHWLIVNIGDSRVYLHRGSDLKQITVDHSLRDELIAGGVNDEHDLPGRNVITRALGSADTAADSWLLPVETGTRILVCSDGLNSEIDDEVIRATLTMSTSPEAAVDELVVRANAAGGRDNITVLVVDVIQGGAAWHMGSEDTSIGLSVEDSLSDTIEAFGSVGTKATRAGEAT